MLNTIQFWENITKRGQIDSVLYTQLTIAPPQCHTQYSPIEYLVERNKEVLTICHSVCRSLRRRLVV